jgi:RNA polymerase sigma-70 factor (ECF subfamily)
MSQEEDKAWFGRNVEAHLDALYGVARRLTRNGADAEDLVAEAVTKAWSSFGSLRDRSRFRPWLFRILNNCYVSDYRKRSVRPLRYGYDELGSDDEDDLTELLIRLPDDFLGWWGNPERELANRLMARDIAEAIEQLPEQYRVTVMLVSVEGLGYDEAAEALGVPPGTVRSRMKRGRTLLQKALWEHASEAGLIGGERSEAGAT